MKMTIDKISESIQTEFKKNQQILSFEEYLKLIDQKPRIHLRGSSQYAADTLDFFGKTGEVYNVFHQPMDGVTARVVGQEVVQKQVYNALKAFARQGQNNRLILLHGPNGSAKSTLVSALMQGLENYSRVNDGALYSFSWVFPIDRVTRGSLGLRGDSEKKSNGANSFAFLEDDEIACIIPSELKDHPVLLLPVTQRKEFFKSLDIPKDADFHVPSRLAESGLSHRDQLIFQALLNNYHGDYAQVLRHIRVERFFLSRVYRSGLVTVEPQMHVDAHYQQLTMNKSLSQLPASLQGLSLFSVSGDLSDANRGMIDYNDLLKRPIDTYKYLLTACENGKVNVGASIVHLDSVFIGSSNELQLDAFKEYPDFSSFKGRIELIKVPYLLKLSQEQEVYEPMLQSIAGEKSVTPHVSWTIAFWGVLTRLKKPQRERYPSELGAIIDKLNPLDKLKLYDTGEVPERLNNEERKLLKANLQKINEEYNNVPYYEGRTGASARELKTMLIDASQNPEFKTLSPLAIAQEIRKFVRRTSEYEFLRQDPVDGYHHHEAFVEVLLTEYTTKVDREVRECLGLYDTKQWMDFMKKYITHLSALLKKEKMKNSITGGYEDPDQALLNEFEGIVGAPGDASAKDNFRQNLITQIGAWALENPKEAVDYFKVFPEMKLRLEKHFYESQKSLLQKMNTALKLFGTDHEEANSEGSKLAHQTLENMQKRFGYSVDGAKEVIGFLMSRKY
jgi:serine protein kinase